jgi:hypothetical protein
MPDSYTIWRDADQQWTERNAPLFDIVFRMFMDDGTWPEVQVLQRFLRQSSVNSIDVRAVIDSKPALPGQLVAPLSGSVILGCRYLLPIIQARGLLDLTVRTTQIAVRKYLTVGLGVADMVVRSDDPELALFMPPTRNRFFEFITSDYPNPFAGGGYRQNEYWSLNVNQDTVWKFDGISTPRDYVDRQLDLIKEFADEQDRRMGIVSPFTTGPRKGFVVMPFEEEWSATSYAFIKKAVDAQGGALEIIRADSINQHGRITDQIVEALDSSDLLIADITGNNANVGWELGHAYAHQKPCIIIMQRGLGAPFDIYDHRRVDYSPTPTADEIERLTAMLRNAIGS